MYKCITILYHSINEYMFICKCLLSLYYVINCFNLVIVTKPCFLHALNNKLCLCINYFWSLYFFLIHNFLLEVKPDPVNGINSGYPKLATLHAQASCWPKFGLEISAIQHVVNTTVVIFIILYGIKMELKLKGSRDCWGW